jgi:hypothetical protein
MRILTSSAEKASRTSATNVANEDHEYSTISDDQVSVLKGIPTPGMSRKNNYIRGGSSQNLMSFRA